MSIFANHGRDPGDVGDVPACCPTDEGIASFRESAGVCFGPNGEEILTNLDPSGDSYSPDVAPGNRMRSVLEDGRLLIGIPSGSNELVRWLGRLSALLLAVSIALTYYLAAEGAFGIERAAFLLAGWAAFLSTLGHWLCARFKATSLLIDPNQLLLRSSFLGIVWHKEYALAGFSKARLIVAHSQDDDPIYAVSVATLDERPQFGAFLRQKEKEWLVRRINSFLGCDDGLVIGEYLDPTPTGAEWGVSGEVQFFED